MHEKLKNTFARNLCYRSECVQDEYNIYVALLKKVLWHIIRRQTQYNTVMWSEPSDYEK